jgi:hypothetical protein
MSPDINLKMECPNCGRDLYLNLDTLATYCKDPHCEYHFTNPIDYSDQYSEIDL